MKKAIKTLCALSLLGASLSVNAMTYSMIVGINDYPTPLDSQGNPAKDEKGEVIDNDLRGCVNDGNVIGKLLVEKYNTKEANVRKLFDKDANKDKFVENLRWLITSAKTGDDVVFFFSGHGAQIENPNAKEPTPGDKIDESLVLADGTLVVDDLFDEIKTILVSKGVNATFVFDCCFSGGMSRDFTVNGRSARSKFLNKNQVGKNYNPITRALMNAARPQVGTEILKAQEAAPGTFAFLYASKESEPSIDLGGAEGVPANGLFTLLLTAVLQEEPKAPAGDLVDMINEFATSKGYKQGPNTEFSSPSRAMMPVFPGAQ